MRELEGNLWSQLGMVDAVCIPTNGCWRTTGEAIMGSGVAHQAMKRFPGIDKKLGSLLSGAYSSIRTRRVTTEPWNIPYLVEVARPKETKRLVKLYSFPTKPTFLVFNGINAVKGHAEHMEVGNTYQGWKARSSIDLIRRSAQVMVELLSKDDTVQTVALPRVGCGGGELAWEMTVRPLLQPIFDDRFIVLF